MSNDSSKRTSPVTHAVIADPEVLIDLLAAFGGMLVSSLQAADALPKLADIRARTKQLNEVAIPDGLEHVDMVMLMASIELCHGYLKALRADGMLVPMADLESKGPAN